MIIRRHFRMGTSGRCVGFRGRPSAGIGRRERHSRGRGRTTCCLSTFGERLIAEEIETAVACATAVTRKSPGLTRERPDTISDEADRARGMDETDRRSDSITRDHEERSD
jgi:hypothetical protein